MIVRFGFRPRGFFLLTLLGACTLAGCEEGSAPVVTVTPTDELQAMLDTLRGPLTLELAPGDYHLEAVDYTDPACGNCEDGSEEVPATRGLKIEGSGIHLRATSARETAIHTHAGYGVLFDECEDCSLSGITVTDGIRDPDGRATDAGVVVRGGTVRLSDCVIRDNLGDSAVVHSVVVGIAGVAVREDALVTVERCRIEGNSWDGIAAYRGARLLAWDNVIDGVDKASGASMGGGRGVGIGLTWDAKALIEGNLVTRYWKGIGVFVDAHAEVTGNVVEDILTWGIAYWGPEEGHPVAWIHDNVVFETGACGVSVDRTTRHTGVGTPPVGTHALDALAARGPGELRGNLIVRTGQNEAFDSGEPYCPQRPIARGAVPDAFLIQGNVIHQARQPGDWPYERTADADAVRGARHIFDLITQRPHLVASRFYGAFGSGGTP